MKTTISVIIPVYNTNKLALRRCLESLSNQSFKDFEVIIIDDGSSVDFSDIKNEYISKDKRINFIRNEHYGISVARNKGLEYAKGEYIAFVDSDDYVEESYLNLLYQAIQDSDIAICGVLSQCYPVFKRWEDRRLFWSQPSRYNGLQYINFCWNKLYRTSIIKNNNIKFDEKIKLGEDALFLASYYKYCCSYRCISNGLYHYECNYNSVVNKYDLNFWDYEQKVIENQWYLFHQYPISGFEEQAMLSWLYKKFKYALYYYIDKEDDEVVRNQILINIVQHPLFIELNRCDLNKNNIHFNGNDRKILKIWKYFGTKGIFITRYIAKYRR